FLEAVQIGNVLEQVGVQCALRQREIGLHVVVEFDQTNLVSLLFELGDDSLFQDIVVVAGRSAEHQILLIGVGSMGKGASQGDSCGGCADQDAATNIQHKVIPCRRKISKIGRFNACPAGEQWRCPRTG